MVDATSGANIIMQMANKPSVALEDPIKQAQEIETLKSTRLANQKNIIGMNQDQMLFTGRAIATLLSDPNTTADDVNKSLDDLRRSGVIPNDQAWQTAKSQFAPGTDPDTVRQRLTRMQLITLSPADQAQRLLSNNQDISNVGGTFTGTRGGPQSGATAGQFTKNGWVQNVPGPENARVGPEIIPLAGGGAPMVAQGRGIQLGTAPGVYDSGNGYNAGQGTYGTGSVAPSGQLSQRDYNTPYKWVDSTGTEQNGVLGTYLQELGKGNARNGQATGPAPGAPPASGQGSGAGATPGALTTQPGQNPLVQKSKEENLAFYRQQQSIASNNAQAIRQGEDVLGLLGETNTGKGIEKLYDGWGMANALARQFNLPEIQPGNVQAYQELKKNLLAQARASGAASGSVGQLEAALGSNPSEKMDPKVIRRMEINLVGDMRIHNGLVNSVANDPGHQADFMNVYQRGRNRLQPMGAMTHRLTSAERTALQQKIEADPTGSTRQIYQDTSNLMQRYGHVGNVPSVNDVVQ